MHHRTFTNVNEYFGTSVQPKKNPQIRDTLPHLLPQTEKKDVPAPVVDETPAPESNVTETAMDKEEQEENHDVYSMDNMDNNEPSGVAPIQPIQHHQDPPYTPQIESSTFYNRPGSATPR